MAKESVRELLRARLGDSPRVNLIDLDASATPGMDKEKKALKRLAKQHATLFELQEKLWAQRRQSVLIEYAGGLNFDTPRRSVTRRQANPQ